MAEQEYTPTTPAEESPVWEAADRLRHHGFPRLAEMVEEMARERAKPDLVAWAQSELNGYRRAVLAERALADERAKRPDREQVRTAAERMYLPLDRPAMSSELTAVQGFVDGAEWALATFPDGKEESND